MSKQLDENLQHKHFGFLRKYLLQDIHYKHKAQKENQTKAKLLTNDSHDKNKTVCVKRQGSS